MAQYVYSSYMVCVKCNWPWLPKCKARCERCGNFFSWGRTKDDTPTRWVQYRRGWRTLTKVKQKKVKTTPSRTAEFVAVTGITMSILLLFYSTLKLFAQLVLWLLT